MKKIFYKFLLLALIIIPCGILCACGEKEMYTLSVDTNCTYVSLDKDGVSQQGVGLREGESITLDVMLDNGYDVNTLKIYVDGVEIAIDNKTTTQGEELSGSTKVGTVTFANLTKNGAITFSCEERLINFSFNLVGDNSTTLLEDASVKPLLESLFFKNVEYGDTTIESPSLYTIFKNNMIVKISLRDYNDKKFILYSNLYKLGGLQFYKNYEPEPYVSEYKYFLTTESGRGIGEYIIEGLVDTERKNYYIYSNFNPTASVTLNINVDCISKNDSLMVNSYDKSFVTHNKFNNQPFEGFIEAYGDGGKLVVNKIEGFDYSNAELYIFDTKILDLANETEYTIPTNKMPIEFASDEMIESGMLMFMPTSYDVFIKGLTVNDESKLDSLELLTTRDDVSFQSPNSYVELDGKYYNATGNRIIFYVSNNVESIEINVDGVNTTYTSADWSTTVNEPSEQVEVYMYSVDYSVCVILDFDATGHEIVVNAN